MEKIIFTLGILICSFSGMAQSHFTNSHQNNSEDRIILTLTEKTDLEQWIASIKLQKSNLNDQGEITIEAFNSLPERLQMYILENKFDFIDLFEKNVISNKID